MTTKRSTTFFALNQSDARLKLVVLGVVEEMSLLKGSRDAGFYRSLGPSRFRAVEGGTNRDVDAMNDSISSRSCPRR